MIAHTMLQPDELRQLIRDRKICWGGHKKLKIYGTLHCNSGKRMRKENRVFFASAKEAVQLGFRPCGHCLRKEYVRWKNGLV